MRGHGLHEHVSTSTSLLTAVHPQRADEHGGERREREERRTDAAMHVQQRPEDQPPAAAWQPPPRLRQRLAAGEPACSPFPLVLRCQLSSEGAENNDAAGSKCAVLSTLPGAWSKSHSTGKAEGGGGKQGMRETQGMIQCSGWGSMEETSWAKDGSPALNPYEHHDPTPCHSCIPDVHQQHPAVACTPFPGHGSFSRPHCRPLVPRCVAGSGGILHLPAAVL